MKSIKEIGGIVFALSNGEFEDEFHLRGRDLITDKGLELLPALGKVVSLNLRDAYDLEKEDPRIRTMYSDHMVAKPYFFRVVWSRLGCRRLFVPRVT